MHTHYGFPQLCLLEHFSYVMKSVFLKGHSNSSPSKAEHRQHFTWPDCHSTFPVSFHPFTPCFPMWNVSKAAIERKDEAVMPQLWKRNRNKTVCVRAFPPYQTAHVLWGVVSLVPVCKQTSWTSHSTAMLGKNWGSIPYLNKGTLEDQSILKNIIW